MTSCSINWLARNDILGLDNAVQDILGVEKGGANYAESNTKRF